MKHIPPMHPTSRRTPHGQKGLRLKPHAFRLLLAGHILILLSLCDFAARLYAGVSVEPLLYIGEYMQSVSTAAILLWGASLGLDIWERGEK